MKGMVLIPRDKMSKLSLDEAREMALTYGDVKVGGVGGNNSAEITMKIDRHFLAIKHMENGSAVANLVQCMDTCEKIRRAIL